jgi:hypothetical protein
VVDNFRYDQCIYEEGVMKRIIEYELEDGGSILVEVDVPEGGGFERVNRRDEITKASISFDKALEQVRPVAQKVISKLRDITDPPDEIVLEFGLKLGAQAGMVLASADAEANYTVTLTWKADRSSGTDAPAKTTGNEGNQSSQDQQGQ